MIAFSEFYDKRSRYGQSRDQFMGFGILLWWMQGNVRLNIMTVKAGATTLI
jgi:hypothetical protein